MTYNRIEIVLYSTLNIDLSLSCHTSTNRIHTCNVCRGVGMTRIEDGEVPSIGNPVEQSSGREETKAAH